MRYWNLRRTAGVAGDVEGESVHKPVGIEVEEAHSEDEVMEAYARATIQWIATKAQATYLHLANVDEIIQRTYSE